MDERQGLDKWGSYTEVKTNRGWQKVRRVIKGIEFSIKNPETADYIKASQVVARLKLNMMSDRLEIENGKGQNQPLSDIQESVIFNALEDYGLRNTGRMRRALHQAAAEDKYHPIKKYLEGLEWDGKDHWQAFMNKLDIASELGDVFIKKFLLGSIAKVYNHAQVYMLVLMSKQGTGKSRLARWFCPVDELFFEGAINPDNKDSQIRLINYWLWEVAELDSTTKRADRNSLKHFITQQQVNVRVPYGRYDISKPATAAMIGTINPDGTGFLNDPTGSRRFALVELDGIDWSYTAIDRDQLWGQLFHEFKNGAECDLTRHEAEVQANINMGHTEESVLESYLVEYFEIDPSQGDWFIGTKDVIAILEEKGLSGAQQRHSWDLAQAATKHKLTKCRKTINGKKVAGYKGIRIDSTVSELSL